MIFFQNKKIAAAEGRGALTLTMVYAVYDVHMYVERLAADSLKLL